MAERRPRVQSRFGPRGEELVIPFNRRKALMLASIWGAVTVGMIIGLFVDPTELWRWAGLVVLVLAPLFVPRRWGARGLLSRNPLLVLDPQGLLDGLTGSRVEWEEVERIELQEIETGDETRHQLDIHRGAKGRLEIPLQFSVIPPDEVLAAVRRFWTGPLEGAAADSDVEPPQKKSRTRRFAESAGWYGVAVVLFTILIVVSERSS